MRHMIEAAPALSVTRMVYGVSSRMGSARWVSRDLPFPHRGRKTLQEKDLTPDHSTSGLELIFPAVHGPGVSRTAVRRLETERRIGDDVDPRGGRPLPGTENHRVLAAFFRETAESVEEVKPRDYRRRRWAEARAFLANSRWRLRHGARAFQTFQLLERAYRDG